VTVAWPDILLATLKENEVRLIAHVPDNVLAPVIAGAGADNYFVSVGATREDEAVGLVAGAYMAGMRGAVLMQTSGFAVAPNVIASLLVPYQIPAILVVSERGTMGEFNVGQVMVSRTLRPTLDAVAVTHHTLTDESTMRFMIDKSIKQAILTQSPVAFILSPLLTGGNPAAAKQKT
jgi:sulfopyruvate decarboxylase alpha subunit